MTLCVRIAGRDGVHTEIVLHFISKTMSVFQLLQEITVRIEEKND